MVRQSPTVILDVAHNLASVEALLAVLGQNRYDYVFVMLPVPTTHAHHAAAAILALQVISSLPEGERPVVLGGGGYKKTSEQRMTFAGRDASG